jgi:hypothetical protein
MSNTSKEIIAENAIDQTVIIQSDLVYWNDKYQRPVTPCAELYDQHVYDRQFAVTKRWSNGNTHISQQSNVMLGASAENPVVKKQKEKKPKNPKSHMSSVSLDNIHSISILCWRRSRSAYIATSSSDKDSDEGKNNTGWHITETVLFTLYRIIGYFVLIAQFMFLWSLLDMYAVDFAETERKRKSFPVKYTASMTDRDFGTGPLNTTIAAWDVARSASNVRQCQAWVLECGAQWALGGGCTREADISSNCPPWDDEKHLQGRNGSQPICYRCDGVAEHGGSPYYGSMSKIVIMDWALG